MIKEQELFEKVAELGEGSHETVDIIIVSERMDTDNPEYRVYHKNGYCFEIEKQQHCEPGE